MRVSTRFLIPLVAAGFLLSACGSSSSSSSNSAAPKPASNGSSSALVKTASNSRLGTILVNAQGFTLYRLSGEHAGKFICTSSACTRTWHPLTVAAGSKPSGSVGSLGMVKRPNGTEQVTYQGMPLYTFAQDQAPGQANGQGIKDVGTWTAVTASGRSGSAGPPAQTSSNYAY